MSNIIIVSADRQESIEAIDKYCKKVIRCDDIQECVYTEIYDCSGMEQVIKDKNITSMWIGGSLLLGFFICMAINKWC